MKQTKIQFKCPECGHDRLVQVRHHIQSREVVDEFAIIVNPSPGKKYNLITSNTYHTEGKIVRFECEACGFIPMTSEKKKDFWCRHVSRNPIVSAKNLHDWLKRNNMLETEQ